MPTPNETLIEAIDGARARGRRVTLDPPMSDDRIASLEQRCGGHWPTHIRALVESAAGFSVDDFRVDFTGDFLFEFEAALPFGLPIATDGAGNFWVVDIGPDCAWGPVLFVSHDPPVVVVQARDVTDFIAQACADPDPADRVAAWVSEVWNRNPYVVPSGQAGVSDDPVLRAFAEEVGPDSVIADLRDLTPGKGFTWGLAGPNTRVRRAVHHLVFATTRKRSGLFARLFSR